MPIPPDVVCVAELNRLFDEGALVGVIPGPVERPDGGAERTANNHKRQDAESGVDVGMAMENLTHRVDAMWPVAPQRLLEVACFL